MLDFVDLMDHALTESSANFLMWLEDDAMVHSDWQSALPTASGSCVVALHGCNFHSCTDTGVYNGAGAVAVLFQREVLQQLIPQLLSDRRF